MSDRAWTPSGHPSLEIQHYDRGDVLVIAPVGDVDCYTASYLREVLIQHRRRDRIVIDLERCEYLDSTGLGVIIGAHKRLRPDGRVALVVTMDRMLHVFRMTGLTKVFTICDTVDDAVSELTP